MRQANNPCLFNCQKDPEQPDTSPLYTGGSNTQSGEADNRRLKPVSGFFCPSEQTGNSSGQILFRDGFKLLEQPETVVRVHLEYFNK